MNRSIENLNTDDCIQAGFTALNSIRWRSNVFFPNYEWYYAESELYVIRCKKDGALWYVKATNPLNAVSIAYSSRAGVTLNTNYPIQKCRTCDTPLPGNIGRVVCRYCGSTYDFNADRNVVAMTKRDGVIPIQCSTKIPLTVSEQIGSDRMVRYLADQMYEQFLEAVKKYSPLEVTKVEYEDVQKTAEYRSCIRVLDKDFTFGDD